MLKPYGVLSNISCAGAPKQKKCGMLSLSDESSPEVDVFNLQSPGPILLANALVSLNLPQPPATNFDSIINVSDDKHTEFYHYH